VLCARKSFVIIKVFTIMGNAAERKLSLVRVCMPVQEFCAAGPAFPPTTGMTIQGRALARTAAVSLGTDTINK
jgi:hypothetical protein